MITPNLLLRPRQRRLTLLLASVAFAHGIAGAQPRQLTDLPPLSPNTEASSLPTHFARVGDRGVFLATTEETGSEWWATDGTPAGTRLLRDVIPGPLPLGGPPGEVAGGWMYFPVSNPLSTELQLWRTDGTAEGTRVLASSLGNQSLPLFLGAATTGGLVFFEARKADGTLWVWRSDGTLAGTLPLVETAPPTLGLGKDLVRGADLGAGFVFGVRTPDEGWEPWVSDGTVAGTRLLFDVIPGGSGSRPRFLGVAAGRLFFLADRAEGGLALWSTDGTPGGTRVVRVLATTGDAIPMGTSTGVRLGERLVFALRLGDNPAALWSTDGSRLGTLELAPFGPGLALWPLELNPVQTPVVRGNRLYFQGLDDQGAEPWETDGTPAGTRRWADLCPGACSSSPVHFFVGPANRVYFLAKDGAAGFRPWVSDGTAAGTRALVDQGPESAETLGTGWLAAGDRVLFNDFTPTGADLYATDGTPAGTQRLVADVVALPTEGVSLDGLAVLSVIREGEGAEPWVSDGTAAGTRPLGNLHRGFHDAIPRDLTVFGNEVLYVVETDTGTELRAAHRGDGAGRTLLDLTAGGFATFFGNSFRLTAVADGVYFVRHREVFLPEDRGTTVVSQVWRTDGTTTQPVGPPSETELFSLRPLPVVGERVFRFEDDGMVSYGPAGVRVTVAALGPISRFGGLALEPFSGELYFLGSDPVNERSLWRTDGTVTGTVRVHTFEPQDELSGNLLAANTTRLFVGLGFAAQNELWSAPAGGPLARVTTLPQGRWIRDMAANSRGVVMLLPHPDGLSFGGELWFSDGTAAGTRALRTFPRIRQLMALGSDAVFVADEGGPASRGEELWLTDGTLAGTRRVADIAPGAEDAMIQAVLRVGDLAFVNATDGAHGGELWALDIVRGGAARVADLFPGPGSSQPESLTLVGDQLLFTATDGSDLTRQIWSLDLADVPRPVPEAPPGPYLFPAALPGFGIKVRLSDGAGSRIGRLEPTCLAETACVSGALPGRPEVFVRVIGPRPNGFLWPTLVRFTTATVEVWIEQLATGELRYYRLDAPGPARDELTGRFDREGFLP